MICINYTIIIFIGKCILYISFFEEEEEEEMRYRNFIRYVGQFLISKLFYEILIVGYKNDNLLQKKSGLEISH